MLRLESPLVLTEAHLIALLRKFVAIPTVSSQVSIDCNLPMLESGSRAFFMLLCICAQPHHHHQCWRGAKFVQELLRCIGAENKLAQV